MSWTDYVPSVTFQLGNYFHKKIQKENEEKAAREEEDKRRRAALDGQGRAAGRFAFRGEQGYGAMTQEAEASRQYLRDLAMGKNSVAAEQLRQGMQQGQAAQASMAAGASPQNAAMAARTAANNMARLGYGMSGQQAIAGLQERNDAQRALAQMILEQRGQDINVALGSRQNAVGAYQAGLKPPEPQGPSTKDQLLGAATALGSALAKSDRRLKTDIEDGEDDARAALRKLVANSYRYKNDRYGKGKHLGVMAQNLEEAGLGFAVVNEPDGKAVDGGKLSTALAAMMATQEGRLSKLERDFGASRRADDGVDQRERARSELGRVIAQSRRAERAGK
ncbi:MAG: tail fiber domain-containing protein [Kofleriaceae bacterium]